MNTTDNQPLSPITHCNNLQQTGKTRNEQHTKCESLKTVNLFQDDTDDTILKILKSCKS